MDGTEAVPPEAQASKSDEEKKSEERNNNGLCHLIMKVKGKALAIVTNAITTALPEGSLALAWANLVKAYAPTTKQARIKLTQEFHNNGLKTFKEDPQDWFNTLESTRIRLK